MTKKQIASRIHNNINWENWEKEGTEFTEYFTINEVLWNRIQWLKDDLTEEQTEELDTLKMLENVLNLINIEDIMLNSQ